MSRRAISKHVAVKCKGIADIRAPNLRIPPASKLNQPFSAARRATDKFFSDNKSLFHDNRGLLLQNVLFVFFDCLLLKTKLGKLNFIDDIILREFGCGPPASQMKKS